VEVPDLVEQGIAAHGVPGGAAGWPSGVSAQAPTSAGLPVLRRMHAGHAMLR
jgi:hypothetical protein